MNKNLKLPFFEDILQFYCIQKLNILFCNIKKNHIKVYILSILHIIGAVFIGTGIFINPRYMIIYLIYLILIFISYKIFNGYCFMTLLSNKLSGGKASILHIRRNTAYYLLLINIIITIIAIYNNKYSFYYYLNN